MYYAKQIDPEYQTAPLSWDINNMKDTWLDGLIFDGNRNYCSHVTDEYHLIEENASDAFDAIDDINSGDEDNFDTAPEFGTKREVIEYYFSREKAYTDDEIKKFCDAVILYDDPAFEEKAMCLMLELLTGKEYAVCEINGSCQGDWQNMYYPVTEWTKEELDTVECEYFNEGSEWVLADEEYDYEPSIEVISGCNYYLHGWNDEMNKKELAEEAGIQEDNLTMLVFDGYIKTPKYRAV